MSIVSLHGVTLKLAGNCLLDAVDWQIQPQERIALVGRNGAGKSTFLGLLTGQIPLIHGNRESFSGLEFATLEQVVFDDE